MQLTDSISPLPGVGEKRLILLNRLNIYTIRDLIEHFPRDYDDRTEVKQISSLIPGIPTTIRGIIKKTPENVVIKGLTITKLVISDETGYLEIVWFNQPYLKNTFKKEAEYIFTGSVSGKFGRIKMENPEYEILDGSELLSNGRIIPIYHSVQKLSQKFFRKLVKNVLDNISGQIDDYFPADFISEFTLCSREAAVKNIHFPENEDAYFAARRRLVFEELLIMQLSLLKMKDRAKKPGLIIQNCDITNFLDVLPFELTASQTEVLEEIIVDLKNGSALNRLIQGDVGSGKTAVAMAVCYLFIKNGYQSAIMVPTEVLANQHYLSFSAYFSKLGIETVLLTGALNKTEKNDALNKIKNSKNIMIVGTHAIIQKSVEFCNLGLVITDEQHRFGVKQRLVLSQKGSGVNVLAMSATPIPRTLAMILYGDMDISIIKGLPPGRQKIDTHYVNSSYRSRLYGFIRKELDNSRQIYIICPMIEDEAGEQGVLRSVKAHTQEIAREFAGFKTECLHSKLKPIEKQEIMNRFIGGETKIIVSTTVIEVGINVPNATVMVIENAERFGLSQLHQLRGRVGRGSEKSYCILITDSKSEVTVQRMRAMKETTDGFKISELDLKIRGSGDFFGTRQHGIVEFKIANLFKDSDILKDVQKAAKLAIEKKLFDSLIDNSTNKIFTDCL